MATHVYDLIDQITPTQIPYDAKNRYNLLDKAENEYEEKIREHLRSLGYGKDEYFGQKLLVQHADGYAEYLVISLGRTNMLVLLHNGDCWDSPYVRKFSKKDIVTNIEARKKLDKFFQK